MHPRTSATAEQLDAADWFSNVGKPVSTRVLRVDSWIEAVARCQADDWRWRLADAATRLLADVVVCLGDSAETFHASRRETELVVKEIMEQTVQPRLDACHLDPHLGSVVRRQVEFDVLNVLLEAEFADLRPPGFFAGEAYWYITGRFPCGWKLGKPVIY